MINAERAANGVPTYIRPKLVFGIPQLDPLSAQQVEGMLKPIFPGHDIVLLGGMVGMMEVRG